jgi:hypothetical protein
MGHKQDVKIDRRAVRKMLGNDAAWWAFQCWDVIGDRGFLGRLRWLFLGR